MLLKLGLSNQTITMIRKLMLFVFSDSSKDLNKAERPPKATAVWIVDSEDIESNLNCTSLMVQP